MGSRIAPDCCCGHRGRELWGIGILLFLLAGTIVLSLVLPVNPGPVCDGPCETDIDKFDDPFKFIHGYGCDPWCVPHIVTPFLIGVFTKSPFFAFFMAGVGEIAEVWTVALFGDFVIFASISDGVGLDTNTDFENLTGSIAEDWLIQGGLGALLSLVLLTVLPFPRLIQWDDLWNPRRAWRFLFYLFWLICLAFVIPIFYRAGVPAFPQLGILLQPLCHLVVFLLIWWLQPAYVWKQYSGQEQLEFWATVWLFSLVINVQNIFEYLCSCGIQSWIYTGAFFVYLFVRGGSSNAFGRVSQDPRAFESPDRPWRQPKRQLE